MSDHLERNRELMRIALSAAVPLWIMRLKRRSEEHRVKRGHAAAQVIAEKGDVLQFGGKGCAAAFNALAESIACLAFVSGGVTFLGDHWEVEPES